MLQKEFEMLTSLKNEEAGRVERGKSGDSLTFKLINANFSYLVDNHLHLHLFTIHNLSQFVLQSQTLKFLQKLIPFCFIVASTCIGNIFKRAVEDSKRENGKYNKIKSSRNGLNLGRAGYEGFEMDMLGDGALDDERY